jgi:hypothetical protein
MGFQKGFDRGVKSIENLLRKLNELVDPFLEKAGFGCGASFAVFALTLLIFSLIFLLRACMK